MIVKTERNRTIGGSSMSNLTHRQLGIIDGSSKTFSFPHAAGPLPGEPAFGRSPKGCDFRRVPSANFGS